MFEKKLIIVGDDLAKDLSKSLKANYLPVEHRTFPDGEIKPRILKLSKAKVGVLLLDMYQDEDINAYIIRFLILANRLKQECNKLIGIIPYLPYARQDKEFKPGDSISAKIIGGFISQYCDYFLTINPHEHRLILSEMVTCLSKSLSIFPECAKEFSDVKDPLVIGPDSEAAAFVKSFVQNIEMETVVCEKKRDITHGTVQVSVPKEVSLKDRNLIIVDDVVSTGGTLLKLVLQLKEHQPKSISYVFAHGLLVGDTEDMLKKTNPLKIVASNSIRNEFGVVDCIPILKQEIENYLKLIK
ncbi:MAG: ribose-phosphate diphosphokinase [Candidatus Pacebacteria bacterium]|nr:ribose-phosphate diphosphokinase [Candidatus Paceibacterota bacterium]